MKFAAANKNLFGERTRLSCGGGRPVRRNSAFTLAEVLAALLFMAIVIPVAVGGLQIASRAGVVAARKSAAARVAERILNENIVTTNWNTGSQSGTVTEGDGQFRWTLHNETWSADPYLSTMRTLSVEVLFAVQSKDYSVSLSTLVDSATATTTTSTQ